jgi:hypothetical protein
MMFRAAVALLALALPAFAQHGGAHAGSSGSRGFSGNAGFSSHPSFSQPSFTRLPFRNRPTLRARRSQPATAPAMVLNIVIRLAPDIETPAQQA